MENKNVGWLIVGIAIVMVIVVLIFNSALKNIVGETCTHGPTCSMYDTIKTQTWISLAIVAIILIIGFVIMFSKPKERLVIKKIKEKVQVKHKPVDYSKLDREEKPLIKLLEESQGTMFQSDLVEKSGFGKVKVSRVLDRLEGKQLIERKRRGLTNIVVLR